MRKRPFVVTTLLILCVAGAAILGPARAKRPKPTPCPPGRFLVTDGLPLVLGGDTVPIDAIVIGPTASDRLLSIESGCDPRRARLKTTRAGTSVRVRWPECGADRKVRFNARIDPDCATMRGTLKAARVDPRPFVALRSFCGDGIVDPGAGEACEDGEGCPGGAACTSCRCGTVPVTTTVPATTTSTTASSTTVTTSTVPATTSTTVIGSTSTTSTTASTTTTTSSTTTSTLAGTPPPDPADVVPPPIAGELSGFAKSTAFLRTSGIQTGADEGAFDAKRVAVVRGRVLDVGGAPIPAVTITVLGEPQFGQTLTRPDGAYDLSLNGGGIVTLRYEQSGHISVQRTVTVPWADFVVVPDVVLLAPSPIVSAITSAGAGAQEALGEQITDGDGTRRALLVVPPGTTAAMDLPGGGTQALGTFHVRITEFTVGDAGPAAMPGELPPTSGYTYAAEFSVDEAVAAGATAVRFSQPVLHYVENFLDFPVGTRVPAGVYDRTTGVWVPFPDGRVVRVVSVTSGRADLDLDGDGTADDPASLGIGTDERERLAVRYPVGQALWRTPMPRFTPWDLNWPYGPDKNDRPPDRPPPKPDKRPKKDPCREKGSVIECQTQTLGEDVPITGASFGLHYRSDRVPGRATRSIEISLTGNPLPPRVKRVTLDVQVAGRQFSETFAAPVPDLVHVVPWDGRDAYGRLVAGPAVVAGRIGYVYDAVYQSPADFERSFAALSGVPLVTNRTRREITLYQPFEMTVLAGFDARILGLGGWTLGAHHAYDARGRLWRGNGDVQDAPFGNVKTITPMEVGSNPGVMAAPTAAPDGSIYVRQECRITRITPDGVLVRVAGTNTCDNTFFGEGVPALGTTLPGSVSNSAVVAPDGSLYVAFVGSIYRIGTDNVLHRVAGNQQAGTGGDGGPALNAQVFQVRSMARGPDGALYVAQAHRIRRIGTDGIIQTIAGGDVEGQTGDGGPAIDATLSLPVAIAFAADGTLYVVTQNRLRRIRPDGIIELVPSVGVPAGGLIHHVFLGRDGLPYVLDNTRTVRRVLADGTAERVYGQEGFGVCSFANDGCGEGGPPLRAGVGALGGGTILPDGRIVLLDGGLGLVRSIAPPLPGFSGDELVVASSRGDEVYLFDPDGRHLRTVDTLTGAVRWQFGYDTVGRLVTLTDGDANVTTVERNGAGTPTAIVAPGGQRTTLTLDADGWITDVTAPGARTTHLTYHGHDGLLATTTDPRGAVHQFGYDAVGRLVSDQRPDRGTTTLTRAEIPSGHTVTVTDGAGLTTVYGVTELPGSVARGTSTGPSGAITESLVRPDGTQRITYPDGTVADLTEAGDPRFGLQVPLLATFTVDTPGGPPVTRTLTRTATIDPVTPFALASQVDTFTAAGTVTKFAWNGADDRFTLTTPTGRVVTLDVDALGRVTEAVVPGVAPRTWTWDAKGRLASYAHGAGQLTFEHDAGNRLVARTDALGHRTEFGWNLAELLASVRTPSLRTWQFARDANGNPTGITPPGGSMHTIAWDAADAEVAYTPPGSAPYTYPRDAAGRTPTVELPGGRDETFSWDAGGRPIGIVWDEAAVTVAYDAGDTTDRPASITRTPVGGGAAQGIEYDWNGPLSTALRFTGPASGNFSYQFDPRYRVQSTTLTAPGGMTVAQTWDGDGLRNAIGPFTLLRSGPEGAPTTISDGTGTLAYGYDDVGRITSRTLTVNGVVVYDADVTFDDAGRIVSQTETDASGTHVVAYVWDDDNQLLQVTRDGTTVETYAYDDRGNRVSRTIGAGSAQVATYDAQDRLLTRGGVAYTLDAAGFLAARGADGFTYDIAGELLAATAGVTYGHDGLRRRVTRTHAGDTTQYLYGNPDDDVELTAVRDPSGTLTWHHYDDGHRLVALQRGPDTLYVATDATGSPRVVADATGAVVRRQRWDAFGVQLEDTNPAFPLAIGFAGGLADPVTGLVRFGLRDYEPVAGRWTSRDPVLFGGEQGNLYAYVGNHPVGVVDRVGLFSIGLSVYELIGVDVRISITRDGISACTGGGVLVGSKEGSISGFVDPFGNLDESGFSLQAKITAALGPLSADAGFDVQLSECPKVKPTNNFCAGPFCTSPIKNMDGKPSVTVNHSETPGQNTKTQVSAEKFGVKAKLGGTGCQQARW